MKRIQFLLAISCLIVSFANAQSQRLSISIGTGFEPTVVMDKAQVNNLPLNIKLGYQFSPLFSLNLFGGHFSSTSQPTVVNDGLNLRTKMEQTFVGLRPELKKAMGDRFEVYGGALVGYMKQARTEVMPNGQAFEREVGSPSPLNPNAPSGRLMYSGFVGVNFFPVKHVGLFAEMGYGVSLFNAGVTARI